MSQTNKKQSTFDEYECGNGPRPPVPGEESHMSKMTTEGASTSTSSKSNSNRSPPSQTEFYNRIGKWQGDFSYFLDDHEGADLLLKYVEEEGEHTIDNIRLKFYFSCEGLKQEPNEKRRRKLIGLIDNDMIKKNIAISDELRETITNINKRKIPANANIFDELQKQIKEIIRNTTYIAFFRSDFFIQYVEDRQKEFDTKSVAIQNQASGSSNASSAIATTSAGTASFADGFAGFSGKTELPPLKPSTNLQTLHEDAELNLSEEPNLKKTTTDRPMPKLTKDLLLATQKGRLEVRPQGAHGYTYPVSFNASYNPVSLQDSERQSLSSASLTDSDVISKDGKPYFHRKPTVVEDYRRCYMNPPVSQPTIAAFKPGSAFVPKEPVGKVSNARLSSANNSAINASELFQKLNALKREQEDQEKQERFSRSLADKLTSAQPRVFAAMEDQLDDDQSILDQHVSRVFSPYLSPGTISPKHLHKYHHRHNEMSTSMPDFVPQAMRHSKSIPENASTMFNTTTKKLSHKWSSQNIDSGISLYSADMPYKAKEMKSTDHLSDETLRKSSKDETRRTRKLPPLPVHQSNFMPTSSSHHTNSLPRMHDSGDEYTFVVYTFGDEKIPYRTKIPGKRLTLKHFKDNLPKKGNYRFFFTTVCDDPDNPVIQEEVINDMDVLPLYEGKIMGTLKSD